MTMGWLKIMALGVVMAAPAAQAGTLFVNGIRADGLRDFEFSNVNIRVDPSGNIWVDAPGYQVALEGQGMAEGPVVPNENAAPGSQHWLVTEDHGSLGHAVEVLVNGTLVHVVRSGDDQVIMDLGPFLSSGRNAVIFRAGVATELGGGILLVHIATGNNQSGTVVLDEPAITIARRSSDGGKASTQTFQLDLP